jgi:hypothetical protein
VLEVLSPVSVGGLLEDLGDLGVQPVQGFVAYQRVAQSAELGVWLSP